MRRLLVVILLGTMSCGFPRPAPLEKDGGSVGNDDEIAIVVASGDGQSGAAGTVLPEPLVAAVTRGGATVAGAAVHFTVVAGNGALSDTVVMTDEQGHASSSLTLGTNLGNNTVEAALITSAVAPAVFHAISQPGSARKIQLASGNQQSLRFSIETAPLTVAILDASDNPVAGYTVAFRVTAGGGALTAASAMTDDTGQAAVQWFVGGPTTNTVEASATGLVGSPVVFAANVSAFASAQSFTLGTSMRGITAADVTADGKPDLLMADSSTGAVMILRNTSIANAATVDFSQASPVDVANDAALASSAAVDLNGDGKPDVLTGSLSGNLNGYINTSSGASLSFGAQTNLASVATPGLAVADYNGDGKLDVAAMASGVDGVLVLLNTTANGAALPSFTAATSFRPACSAVGGNPQGLKAADMNGDGKPDVVIACGTTDGAAGGVVSILLNQTQTGSTTPAFAALQITRSAHRDVLSVALADFNGDGKPDIVVVNQTESTVSVLLNTTAPQATTVSFAPAVEIPTGSRPFVVVAADLNGDGRPDIATANTSASASVSVLANLTPRGATTLSFAPEFDLPLPAAARAATLADLNGDGLPDVVVAMPASVSVFRGQ